MKINIVALLIIGIISYSSCKKKVAKAIDEVEASDQIFVALNQNCEIEEGIGYDSQVGSIICSNNSFTYDYGWHGNEGPKSMLENFRNTFKGYHYQSFFTNIGMDKKTFKLMASRVDILDATPIYECVETLMFECKNCNAVASIDFKDKVFYFPYQENKALVADWEKYEFHHLTKDGYFYKIYASRAEQNDCGMIAKPLDSNDQNKLSISCNEIKSMQGAVNYLTSVRMSSTTSKE